MKKRYISVLSVIAFSFAFFTGCGNSADSDSETVQETTTAAVAVSDEKSDETAVQTAEQKQVVEEGMTPVYGKDIKDGVYDIKVDSSSSMFNITECQLTVSNGEMTATMTMGGKGYLYLFMGTKEDAEKASEDEYISFEESGDVHKFTVPVEALDMGIDCAAFSKKKEIWYDRTLLFRADSLPAEALGENLIKDVESLGLSDGEYNIEVSLEGGSGRASVQSPAKLTVNNGEAVAEIVWSSSNYDYMIVDGEKYYPVNSEGNAVFEIPVTGFDYKMPVSADTTAMSTPHEIEYTLYFDSGTIEN